MAKSPDVKASSPNVHTQGDVATHIYIYQINTRKHIPDKHISDRAQLKHISDKHTRYIHIYIYIYIYIIKSKWNYLSYI